jgi:dTDP-4-amino-4,6-dideoxygalactose transaminase
VRKSFALILIRARFLSQQARDPAPHYEHSQIGYNYRLSNLLAAVGRGQLERLDEKVAKKREINAFYEKALNDLPGVNSCPRPLTEGQTAGSP